MSCKIFFWCALISVSAGCASSTHRFDRADFSKPEFFPVLPWDPLHGWNGRPVEDRSQALSSIAACHFNLGGFVLPQDLPQCQKLGLGALLLTTDPAYTNLQYIYEWRKLSDEEIDRRVKRAVDGGGRNPAIAGYFITDEPSAVDFPALGRAVAAVKKYAPGKLAYINLLPNYATLGAPDTSQLGTATYNDYLEKFVAEVKPQLLSYDNYMVQYSMDLQDRATAALYYENLLDVRRVALEHDLPYLNIVASCQLQKDKPAPSFNNLLFQACTTLAAGYRGVTWYTYFGDVYPHAPLDKAGRPTPVWTDLQEVNRQVETLAPILSKLASTGVYFSAPAPADGLPLLPGHVIQSVSCSNSVMVGEFRDAAGATFAMVVNLSLKGAAGFTFEPTAKGKAMWAISNRDGRRIRLHDREEIWLTAGQGVVLSFGR